MRLLSTLMIAVWTTSCRTRAVSTRCFRGGSLVDGLHRAVRCNSRHCRPRIVCSDGARVAETVLRQWHL